MVTASLDSSSPHADCGSCTSVGYRPGIHSRAGVFPKIDSNECVIVGRTTSLYFGDSFHFLYTQRVASEVRRAHLTTRKQFHVREMFCKGRAGGWTRRVERLLEGLADGQPNAWMDGRKAWKG